MTGRATRGDAVGTRYALSNKTTSVLNAKYDTLDMHKVVADLLNTIDPLEISGAEVMSKVALLLFDLGRKGRSDPRGRYDFADRTEHERYLQGAFARDCCAENRLVVRAGPLVHGALEEFSLNEIEIKGCMLIIVN